MAKRQVGLAPAAGNEVEIGPASERKARAFVPYLMLIAILIVTRMRFLPLRA